MPLAKSGVFRHSNFFLSRCGVCYAVVYLYIADVDYDLAMAVKHVYGYQGVAAAIYSTNHCTVF